jgi:hypothetical protein
MVVTAPCRGPAGGPQRPDLVAFVAVRGRQSPERDALFGWVLWLKDAGSVPAALLDGNGNGDGNVQPVR